MVYIRKQNNNSVTKQNDGVYTYWDKLSEIRKEVKYFQMDSLLPGRRIRQAIVQKIPSSTTIRATSNLIKKIGANQKQSGDSMRGQVEEIGRVAWGT